MTVTQLSMTMLGLQKKGSSTSLPSSLWLRPSTEAVVQAMKPDTSAYKQVSSNLILLSEKLCQFSNVHHVKTVLEYKKMMATWNSLIPPRVFRICLWVEWMENDSEWSTNFTLDVLTYPIASILAKVIAVGMVPKNLTKFKIRIQWMAEKVRLLTSIWDL